FWVLLGFHSVLTRRASDLLLVAQQLYHIFDRDLAADLLDLWRILADDRLLELLKHLFSLPGIDLLPLRLHLFREFPRPLLEFVQDRKSTRLNSSHVKISYA